MKRREIFTYMAGLFGVVAVLVSCGPRSPGDGSGGRLSQLTADESSRFMDDSVTYCRTSMERPKDGKVLVALDASGSMVGHTNDMGTLVHWFQQSLSRVRESRLRWTESPLCLFNEGLGFGSCRDAFQPLTGYQPRTDTVLHKAIQRASDYDVSLILTDGVANAKAGGSGDCAGGVDATCVARTLRRVLSQQSVEFEHAEWGLWLLPLVTRYAGDFFTEQAVSPDRFDSELATTTIEADLGGNPRIINPRNISDGSLAFEYVGPRTLVVWVLAREADLGRAMVEALIDRAGHSGLTLVDGFRYVENGIAVLPPIEVYPGLVNPVEWTELRPWLDEDVVGTMDYELDAANGTTRIQLTCPAGAPGEGLFALEGRVVRDTEHSGCVELNQLAAVSFQLRPNRSNQKADLDEVIPAYQGREVAGHAALDLHLRCVAERSAPCTRPVEAEWRAAMDYGQSADCLARDGCGSRVVDRILALSTKDPTREPHKIFGFAETLEELYRLSASDASTRQVGAFEICRSDD